jgi:hypothetical protein
MTVNFVQADPDVVELRYEYQDTEYHHTFLSTCPLCIFMYLIAAIYLGGSGMPHSE